MKPKPRVCLFDLVEAYARVNERFNKGLRAMEARQAELFDQEVNSTPSQQGPFDLLEADAFTTDQDTVGSPAQGRPHWGSKIMGLLGDITKFGALGLISSLSKKKDKAKVNLTPGELAAQAARTAPVSPTPIAPVIDAGVGEDFGEGFNKGASRADLYGQNRKKAY